MSGALKQYLGVGLAAARPVTPAVQTDGLAFYYATDTSTMSFWDGAWNTFTPGSPAWGAITGTLSAQTDLQTALDAKQARAPAVQSVTSSGTVTPTFADDLVIITAQAAPLTLANPTGTAIPGLGIGIRIKDDGTARAITFGSQYRAIDVTLPTTTVIGKTLYLGMIYNATDTKWDVVAVAQEA